MVNKNMLLGRIAAAGYSQRSLAKEMKVSKNTLNAKINGKIPFNTADISDICGLLHIEDNQEKAIIFLA